MRPHIRIEKPETEPGRLQVVTYDKVIAVGADGVEVEISHCVTAWHEHSQVGEMRRLEVILGGHYITQEDGTVILTQDEDKPNDVLPVSYEDD